MRTRTLIEQIATLIEARENCIRRMRSAPVGTNDHALAAQWKENHEHALHKLEQRLPSGAGIDAGTTINLDRSTREKTVLQTSYHHMNDSGMYDGWTEHAVTVSASLVHRLNIRIGGPNRNQIKDYLHDVFTECLLEQYQPARPDYAVQARELHEKLNRLSTHQVVSGMHTVLAFACLLGWEWYRDHNGAPLPAADGFLAGKVKS